MLIKNIIAYVYISLVAIMIFMTLFFIIFWGFNWFFFYVFFCVLLKYFWSEWSYFNFDVFHNIHYSIIQAIQDGLLINAITKHEIEWEAEYFSNAFQSIFRTFESDFYFIFMRKRIENRGKTRNLCFVPRLSAHGLVLAFRMPVWMLLWMVVRSVSEMVYSSFIGY